ncbi:MAG: class I SAM-dependent methyltransferase [Dehalococcoidia bacterium]|nr:class I SAM-dependent methyltransferase [Dehalococcoidia bacterium]
MKPDRRSHAVLGRASREAKARKIESLVRKHSVGPFRRVLDVGTGSGFVANYLYRMGYGTLGIHAVDVIDERQVTDGFHFQLVKETSLPFPDGFFDLIVSNHVVEHLGSEDVQIRHVEEVYRCLEPRGILYFAVPNRWQLVEPHYRLPFLSWLSHSAASAYVRLFRRGSHYDCCTLSRSEAIRLLGRAGFTVNEVTLDAIPVLVAIEGGAAWKRTVARLPRGVLGVFAPFMPTLIFICTRPDS